jgi:hypothetical protein
MPVIPALGKLRQEEGKFRQVGYIVRPCLKKEGKGREGKRRKGKEGKGKGKAKKGKGKARKGKARPTFDSPLHAPSTVKWTY